MFREELRIHKIAKPATMKTKFKFFMKIFISVDFETVFNRPKLVKDSHSCLKHELHYALPLMMPFLSLMLQTARFKRDHL